MPTDTPEPLWREVVGNTEPWRRGRLFLILLAIWQLLSQSLLVWLGTSCGNVEGVVALALSATVAWLLFYFIWIGVHWVRWVSGGIGMLIGFAKLIWGIRDGSPVFLLDGTIGFITSSYLALAPSVYFFAQRQKEVVRWKEALAVGAVFALLLVSFGATSIGFFAFRAHREADARQFADRAFRRIFLDGDQDFLKRHATERLMRVEGWARLSWFMADRYMRVGEARDLQAAQGRLQFSYRFPAVLLCSGRMSSYAVGHEGRVRLLLGIVDVGGEWQIDAIWWQYTYD